MGKIMKRFIHDIHDFAAQNRLSLRQVMDFTTTVNPLGPPARAKNAFRKSLKALGHHPDRKARHLVQFIARSEGVNEENVLVGGSFGHLINTIFQASGTKTALVPSPYPAYYRELVSGGQTDFSFLPLDERDHFRLNPEKWMHEMAQHDAAIITYPSFISADGPSPENLLKFLRTAQTGKTLFLVDETLLGYTGQTSVADNALKADRCLVVRSLSEYYALAGLPVSYVIGEERTIQGIRQHASINHPDTVAAATALAAMKDPGYRKRTLSFMKSEHRFIEEGLSRISGISFFTTGCGFLVVSMHQNPSKSLDIFSRYHIIIDELNGPGNARHLFFPVKDHKWNARYLKTLKNIMGGRQQ